MSDDRTLGLLSTPRDADDPDGLDPDGTADGTWWRRNRSLVVIGVLLALGLAAAALVAPRGAAERLGPDNPAPDGSRALVQILGREGVDVSEVSVFDDVIADARAGTTVLVLDSGVLDPDRLRELRATGADLVLVQPGLPVLQVLAPEVTVAGSGGPTDAEPGCEDPDARAAGEVRAGGRGYAAGTGGEVPGVAGEPASPTATVAICYPTDAVPPTGSYVVVEDPQQDRRVVVHGQDELLTNQFLAEEGNAALALRSLGRTDTLLWYRVDPLDVTDPVADAPSAVELLPRWVDWVVVQLAVVLVAVLFWRFRRLGRLVPERLPVLVRSAEAAEGRARLYRSAGARGASAALLRAASSRRLGHRLGARTGAEPEAVARLAAAASGRDPTSVLSLLHGPDPHDDASLVRLADALDELEREVTDR